MQDHSWRVETMHACAVLKDGLPISDFIAGACWAHEPTAAKAMDAARIAVQAIEQGILRGIGARVMSPDGVQCEAIWAGELLN
jgi:hypothetical protein